jgi:hypothetical protein
MENNEVRAATETVKKSEMLDIRLVSSSRSTCPFHAVYRFSDLYFQDLKELFICSISSWTNEIVVFFVLY